jgi:predicted flap endonuclease-1-like 5' DNA nuclease
MSSYLIELLVWALLAYLLGCLIGCWLKKLTAGDDPIQPVKQPVKQSVVTPPAPKVEIPTVAKVAAAVATAAIVKEIVTPKVVAPPAPPPPPPPRPVMKAAPPPLPPPVVKAAPVKVITREMHTKADPLPTVRAATTTLPNHLTRKAEEIHHDKTIRHVEARADSLLEKRVGTTRTMQPEPVKPVARVVAPEPVRTVTRVTAPEPVRTVTRVEAAPVRAAAAPTVQTVEIGASSGGMARPKGIADARGGRPDDLQRISGVGPKNEKILHKLGFYHFDQIAAWSESEASWVDDHLKFGGRVRRENWIHQAGLLAAGKEAEFLKLYGTGGQKRDGASTSGSKTRK